MNDLDTLHVLREDHVPSELIDPFIEECLQIGVEPQVEAIPKRVAFNAVEDYIPTALALFIAKPFLEAFLKRAGEDAYILFKRSLSALIKKASLVRVKIFASAPGKFDPQYPYSRFVSIYSRTPEGYTLKFLYHTEEDQEYFDEATSAVCDIVKDGSIPPAERRPIGRVFVYYYDREQKKWRQKLD